MFFKSDVNNTAEDSRFIRKEVKNVPMVFENVICKE